MATTTSAPGLIESHVLYRQDEICKRLGWGRRAYDAAVRRGLPVLRSGKRVYLHGSSVLEWVKSDSAARSLALNPLAQS
jgi:hypothetical protein